MLAVALVVVLVIILAVVMVVIAVALVVGCVSDYTCGGNGCGSSCTGGCVSDYTCGGNGCGSGCSGGYVSDLVNIVALAVALMVSLGMVVELGPTLVVVVAVALAWWLC